MRKGRLTLLLALDAAAVGASCAAVIVAVGLPLAAAGELRPVRLLVLAAGAAAAVAVLGGALLVRSVGRPVDRLLAAAERLGASAGDLPLLGPPEDAGGRGLSGAAVAFERLAGALAAERARLADKVGELERANAALLHARESLVRAERLATAGRLASGVAHEVGNPLGAITGYVELARDRLAASDDPETGGREPSEARRVSPRQEVVDFLSRIASEAQRIDRIVRDLLDLARPAETALGPVDLAAPIDAAVRLARVQGRLRGVEVEVLLPPGLPAVSADAHRLAQVFLNLLLNAGDAISGAGTVRVTARAEGEHVEVEVADSGPGIPDAHLSRLFEPFFTTKPAGQGTGLGLAISQGIVESFGGELAAANARGGGARLTVRLRVA